MSKRLLPDTPGTLSGHFLDTPEPGARRRHSARHSRRHPDFRGHSRRHSWRHFGPERNRETPVAGLGGPLLGKCFVEGRKVPLRSFFLSLFLDLALPCDRLKFSSENENFMRLPPTLGLCSFVGNSGKSPRTGKHFQSRD